jgi:hypothetical protein
VHVLVRLEFGEAAVLERDAQAIEDATGWPVVIVDANNVNVEVLGGSGGVPVPLADVRLAVLDNPLGQGEEQTPIVLMRPGPADQALR